MYKWFRRSLIATNIFVNVVFLLGQPNETVSLHAWRASKEGKTWGRVLNAFLCWVTHDDHGRDSALGDLARSQGRVDIVKKLLGE